MHTQTNRLNYRQVNHWVLTANHVAGSGEPDVVFSGVTYLAVSGSKVQLENETGQPPDLAVFRLTTGPNLPILPIRATAPGMFETP